MKMSTSLFTPWNALGVGLGVVSLAFFADALSGNHAGALAQSRVVRNVSRTLDQLSGPGTPDSNSLSRLLHVGKREYRVTFDAGLSQEPLSSLGVTKIGFGRISHVNIITTASGVYSTDGLASPHIRYPGVSVVSVPAPLEGTRIMANTDFIDWQQASSASVETINP